MKRLINPETLLGRTVQALAAAFLLFGLLAAALLQFTLVEPHTRQAADDLASFLVLVSKIWVELPPNARSDYEKELSERHELRVIRTEAAHPKRPNSHSYLNHLETALSRRVGHTVYIHRHPEFKGWLWADFPVGGRIIRLGFQEQRLQNHVFVILPLLAVLGVFVAFALSVVLVRRITRPLASMAEATRRIGSGDFSAQIPETGPREIADLARKLNLMERQIGQLLENRTTLLAGISHDLRTPLSRMRLELELLEADGNVELIDGLRNDITEMERLISQTLLLARGLAGETAAETDINALLDSIADDFCKAGNRVLFQPTHACTRATKPGALKRVVTNLVENAVIYSEAQPVTLACDCSTAAARISITDQGPGIPTAERSTVFQPFHRLEGSRSRATGGSGLGLAIVEQLCRTNGWDLQVTSPPGGGTTFSIGLPPDPH